MPRDPNKIRRRRVATRADYDPDEPDTQLRFASGHLGPAIVVRPTDCPAMIPARRHWRPNPTGGPYAVCLCTLKHQDDDQPPALEDAVTTIVLDHERAAETLTTGTLF